jgi:hypothetical protein
MRIYNIAAGRAGAFALVLMCATGGTAAAQWLSLPLPGTPRTPDGKPNLNAPPARSSDGKPDLSGIWRADSPRYNDNLLPAGVEAPMLPQAAAMYKRRVETFGYNRPMTFCMPHGVPDAMTVVGLPFKILQMPGVTVLLFEEFHKYRQIHTDGRQLPIDPDPAWYGYSVGRWEGDTFVVETAGFKEGSWLDNSGHPHTDALRTTERFRRINFGRLEVVATIDDPKAYSRPWTSQTMGFVVQPDTELLEHLCENNRSLESLKRYWEGPDQAAPPTTGK